MLGKMELAWIAQLVLEVMLEWGMGWEEVVLGVEVELQLPPTVYLVTFLSLLLLKAWSRWYLSL